MEVVLGVETGFQCYAKECQQGDSINLGVWPALIIIGHSNGAARAIYSLTSHSVSSIQTISGDMTDLISFSNVNTYGLQLNYIGTNPDTIYVKVLYSSKRGG